MRKYLVVLGSLLAFLAGSAYAETPSKTDANCFYYKTVRGKRGRKYVRHFLLRKNLTGDKKKIYEKYGYTPDRLRIDGYGRIIERWRYYALGLEFTFDQNSNLIGEREINKEDRSVN